MDSNLVENLPPKPSQEEEILELAKKELLREIKCASIRAEQFGAHSWAKPQKYVPSKRFLKYMIVNDSKFNDRKEQRSLERREVSRSRHSSSYVRHIEDPSEKPSRSYFLHSRYSKKREVSSDDEGNRKRAKLYPENVKYHSERKTFKKNTVFETNKRSKISPNEIDRGIKIQKEKSSSGKEKHCRRKIHKNSTLEIDKKRGVSSDKEDKQIKNVHCMSPEKKKHPKRKKSRKKFPSEIDNEPSTSHSKHEENIKEMSSEDDWEISSLSRHGKKHSKKHSKKKT